MGRGSAGPGDLPGATEHGRKPTIAVFNSSEDTVDLLRTALESEGFQTVVGHIPDVKKGEIDLIDFINHHAPSVTYAETNAPVRPRIARTIATAVARFTARKIRTIPTDSSILPMAAPSLALESPSVLAPK